jgi:imidazoleglycerol-phosphate dehydratase
MGPSQDGSHRSAMAQRTTQETKVSVALNLDGSGRSQVSTGIPFFDHMLCQLPRHGIMDLDVEASGDTDVDSHHTVEDVALVLGSAFREAISDKRGITRFASGTYPLDEALVECCLDVSGRPYTSIDLRLERRQSLGNPPFNPELASHFFQSFATEARVTLHILKRAGTDTHHIIEAAFKGFSRTLWTATRRIGEAIPSTKGTL